MAFLTRQQAAALLCERGLSISERTLADLALDRRGPPAGRWGRLCIYDEDELLDWARDRLWSGCEKHAIDTRNAA